MRSIWASCWIGILYSTIAITTSLTYIRLVGPMFGEWGWLHLAIALLVLGILLVVAVGALDHQPNPYGRTHPMYDLKDVPVNSGFRIGGFGWVTQLLPMLLAIVALILIDRSL